MLRLIAAISLPPALLAAVSSAAEAQGRVWALTDRVEIRYETHANITASDLAAGKTPGFTVRVDASARGGPVLRIAGDENKQHTGYVLAGRRVRIPASIPGGVFVHLAYRRECTMGDRAPGLFLYLFTPRGWDALSRDPRRPLVHGRRPPGTLFRAYRIAGGRSDTLQWTPWTSPSLRGVLERFRNREVVVALCMAAMHAGATEWAEFRRPRLVFTDRAAPSRLRTPQYPPKRRRTLLTDSQIALARKRCAADKSAAAIRDQAERIARPWMQWSDEKIRSLIPPADVPRAFNVSTVGCPVHGKAVYRHGTYPWKLDISKPFTIICPVGGETFPSNDFAAYLRSGFQDRSLLTGKYADDGWGWAAPNGTRYWFVAYACHWHWSRYILPAVLQLSRAYLLTGDPAYAHKCAVMLDRIADVYPAMDYENQSRFGWESGGRYPGKILNHIWETRTLRRLAEAYDNIFDALRDGGPLEGTLAKSCRRTRANIEAGILEEGIAAVHDGRIRGNFGMHQCALAMAATVRETCPVRKELDWILHGSGEDSSTLGVEYAFYNFIYKDGMPFETSPGYCFSWVANFVSLARILKPAGYDFYAAPKFKAMFDAFLDLVCIGRYTPAVGDAGSITSGRIGGSIPVYLAAFTHYRSPRFARALAALGAFRHKKFWTYESLFEPDALGKAETVAAETPPTPLRSRVLDGYGLGILNNPRDTLAVSMYYGVHGGHGHFDRLNFSLFAYGRKMTPDLGYPDFMNALIPGIYTWSKNTISHNCVVVDRKRQLRNVPGKVLAFLDAPDVQFLEVSAAGTYPQASEYRRALVLVDSGPDGGYLVDVFTAAGGEEHDYSLHGPPGRFRFLGGALSPPRRGTLAGEDVPYGRIYDDPVLGAAGYHGGYSGYTGSGFQHLEHVQTLLSGKQWWACWTLDAAEQVGLRLRILAPGNSELFVCDGRVSPTGKTPWVLKYLVCRRRGKNLRSRFVSLLEPYRGRPQVRSVQRTDVAGGVCIRVEREGGADVLYVRTDPGGRSMLRAGPLSTDACFCCVRYDAANRPETVTMLGGTRTSVGGRTVIARPSLAGRVTRVAPDRRAVTIRLDTPGGALHAGAFLGRPVFFFNPLHRCMYTVRALRPQAHGAVELLVAEPEMRTGRARITRVDSRAACIVTSSRFAFPAIYPGMALTDESGSRFYRVRRMVPGRILLADRPVPSAFRDANGDGVIDAWLCDVGPGDRCEILSVTRRRLSGR